MYECPGEFSSKVSSSRASWGDLTMSRRLMGEFPLEGGSAFVVVRVRVRIQRRGTSIVVEVRDGGS